MAEKEKVKEEKVKEEVSEVKAFARGVHISPRKARLVVNLMRKMTAVEALEQLNFINKKAAGPIKKLVDSAVANASHNFQIDKDRLFIKSITVDGGPVLMRYKPRAQGRALPVRKRTSHLNLVLGVSSKPLKTVRMTKKAVIPEVKEEIPPKKEESAEVGLPVPEKKNRFAFWKKKSGDASQLSPKDLKGKKYTSYDRRSGS